MGNMKTFIYIYIIFWKLKTVIKTKGWPCFRLLFYLWMWTCTSRVWWRVQWDNNTRWDPHAIKGSNMWHMHSCNYLRLFGQKRCLRSMPGHPWKFCHRKVGLVGFKLTCHEVFCFPFEASNLDVWIGWLNPINPNGFLQLQGALSQPAPVVIALPPTRHVMLEKFYKDGSQKTRFYQKLGPLGSMFCIDVVRVKSLPWNLDPSGSPRIFKGCSVISCLTIMKQMKIVAKTASEAKQIVGKSVQYTHSYT